MGKKKIEQKSEEESVMGRPLKFKTVKELQNKIDAYFKQCDDRKIPFIVKETGKEISISAPEPYTITGLAYFLGTTRETLLDYEHNRGDDFSYTIKRAKTKIEYGVELRSIESGKPVGAIFNLKNNFKRWNDKSELELGGSLSEVPQAQINVISTKVHKDNNIEK